MVIWADGHWIVVARKPPSTLRMLPVTKDEAASETTYTAAPTSSDASPNRRVGVCPMNATRRDQRHGRCSWLRPA